MGASSSTTPSTPSQLGLAKRFCDDNDKFAHAQYRSFRSSNYLKIYDAHVWYKLDTDPFTRQQHLGASLQGTFWSFKPLSRQHFSDCPGNHGLKRQERSGQGMRSCKGCCSYEDIRPSEVSYQCQICHFELCRCCYQVRRTQCRNGHTLQEVLASSNDCDAGCGRTGLAAPAKVFRCSICSFSVCEKCVVASDDPEVNAVWIYTLEGVYAKVTAALIMDDPDVLQQIMPFCRAVNKYIVDHPAPRNITLWHASKVVEAQKAELDPSGKKNRGIFRIPKYMSAAEELHCVAPFLTPGSPIFKFQVKEGCFNATPIKHHSKFPDELEWLMPPYTPFRWVEQSWQTLEVVPGNPQSYLVITFEVLDGKVEEEDVPTSLCMVKPDPSGSSSDPQGGLTATATAADATASTATAGATASTAALGGAAMINPMTGLVVVVGGLVLGTAIGLMRRPTSLESPDGAEAGNNPLGHCSANNLDPGLEMILDMVEFDKKDTLRALLAPMSAVMSKIPGSNSETLKECTEMFVNLVETLYYTLKNDHGYSHELADTIAAQSRQAYKSLLPLE